MFIVERFRAQASLREQTEIDSIVTRLTTLGYRPVLRSMLSAACEVATVPPGAVSVSSLATLQQGYRPPQENVLVGELLFPSAGSAPDTGYVIQPLGNRLEAWEIRHHLTSSNLVSFCTAVEQAAKATLDGRRLRGMNFTWRPTTERLSRGFYSTGPYGRPGKEADLKTKRPEYSDDDLRASILLAAPDVRRFLLELAQYGKVRAVDAGLRPGSTEQLLQEQVLRKEYLVLCKQDSRTICKVPDRAELEDLAGGKFTCTVCGRAFRDETVQDIFALTEFGRQLLASSRWMTIWVTDMLVRAGINRDDIAWNPTAGADELDIMTDALGREFSSN